MLDSEHCCYICALPFPETIRAIPVDSLPIDTSTYMLCAEYSKRYQSILMAMPYDIMQGLRPSDGNDFTRPQKDAIGGAIHAYIDLCAEQQFMHMLGAIPDKVWENWVSGIRRNFELRGIRLVWEDIRSEHRYDELRAIVDPP